MQILHRGFADAIDRSLGERHASGRIAYVVDDIGLLPRVAGQRSWRRSNAEVVSHINIRRAMIQKQKGTLCALAVATLLAVCWLVPGCDDDKPTEPEPAKEYVFYFNDASYSDRYYRYHTVTGKVDSLSLPFESYDGFVVSPDGKRLYLSDGDKTVVVSTESFEVVTELTNLGGGVEAVSNDNEYLAVCGEDLYILESAGYSVVHHDTDRVSQGSYSQDGSVYYAAGGWVAGAPTLPYMYRVDLSISPPAVTRKSFPDGPVWRVVPSIDERRLFLLLRFDTFGFLFEVYDVDQDSVIFRQILAPGSGDIELTPDGRYAFYTNPGTLLDGPPPSVFVTVFDLEKNIVMDSIVTPSPVHGHMIPSILAISPDGKQLIAGSARGQGSFSVIDAQAMVVLQHFYLGNQVDLLDVICQSAL